MSAMFCTILALAAISNTLAAQSPADENRERRVRVALALAEAAQCGQCQFDEDKARARALVERKPLVMFVGTSCQRCGAEVNKLGAVAVVVDRLNKELVGPEQPRVIIQTFQNNFWETKAVLPSPTSAEVLEAVKEAVKHPVEKKSGKKLDWNLTDVKK